MGRKDNLAAGIMTTIIICIFLVTTYFCLDIFGIIDVPDNLSLVQLLASHSEETMAIKPIDELVITEDNIDEWINKNTESSSEEPIDEEEPIEEIPQRIDVPDEEIHTEQIVEETQNYSATNKVYYYQLDMYGKMIYDRMLDNVENLKTGTYTINFDTQFNDLLHEETGEETLERAFQFGINALLFDHPEIFYLDITKMYMSTEITSFGPLRTYRVSIGGKEGESYLAEGFYNEQSVKVVSEMVESVKANIERNIIDDSTYKKIEVVHDYLVDTVDYEKTVSKTNIYNIYGALISKEAVCEGYSKAFKYVMDDFGIPCVIVCGVGQNSNGQTESHAWNYVKIDNNWYAIDCTWDDPIILGSGYVSDSVYRKYFLKGSNDFFVDHIEDGKIVDGSNFIYPTLSPDNY